MADLIKIIDTGSGSGYDYSSLSSWEAAYGGVGNYGDCVGQNQRAIAKCRATTGAADTTSSTIPG